MASNKQKNKGLDRRRWWMDGFWDIEGWGKHSKYELSQTKPYWSGTGKVVCNEEKRTSSELPTCSLRLSCSCLYANASTFLHLCEWHYVRLITLICICCACACFQDSHLGLLAAEQEGTWQVCQACCGVFSDGGVEACGGLGWRGGGCQEAMCCYCHMSHLAR